MRSAPTNNNNNLMLKCGAHALTYSFNYATILQTCIFFVALSLTSCISFSFDFFCMCMCVCDRLNYLRPTKCHSKCDEFKKSHDKMFMVVSYFFFVFALNHGKYPAIKQAPSSFHFLRRFVHLWKKIISIFYAYEIFSLFSNFAPCSSTSAYYSHVSLTYTYLVDANTSAKRRKYTNFTT